MINQNWSRWIKTSIRKYFDDNKGALTLKFEPQKQLTNEYVQLRISGPTFNEWNGNIYEVIINVNVLINSLISQTDLYKIERTIGKLESLFTRNINIINDQEQIIGCLTKINRVITTYFGKQDAEIEQATIESTYRTILQGE